MSRTEVTLYFDLVSPYSYLALAASRGIAERHGIAWRPRSVVYGVLLDRTGLVGPAEVETKRRYTFADIQRAAALLGVPMVGPPTHPFRSLDALRAIESTDDDEARLERALRLGDACWGRGLDLTDPGVLRAELLAAGEPSEGLDARMVSEEARQRLRDNTSEALQAGVFGVPTFRLGDELFWGHDRIDHLVARLEGRIGPSGPALEAMLARPRGTDRKASPAKPAAT